MTDNADGHSRGPGRGGGGGEGRGGARGGGGGHQQDGFGSGGGGGGFMQQQQQQQQQDFSSWRNPIAAAAAGMAPADAAYNNFYYSGGYSPFSAGDMRDSIAAIWSRTSPSGEGVAAAAAFSGGYGQFPDSSPGQFAANSNPAGQFAANLTGHFAATNELGMFGAGAGDYSAAYGQQYGYGGQQYTQWGDGGGGAGAGGGRNNGAGGTPYSYLGGQAGEGRGGDRGVAEAQQGMDGMRLGGAAGNRKGESNGYQQAASGGGGAAGQPKKMSWANVASQPAKPVAPVTKTKKPGVLPPPAIIPSSNKPTVAPPAPAPSSQVSSGNPPAPAPAVAPAPAPPTPEMASALQNDVPLMGAGGGGGPPQQPQPPFSTQIQSQLAPHQLGGPPGGPEPRANHLSAARDSEPRRGEMRPGGGGPVVEPPRSNMVNHGPRGGRVATNGGGSGAGGLGGLPPGNVHVDRSDPRSPMGGGGGGGGGGPIGMGSGLGMAKGPGSHPILETLRSVNEYNPRSFDLMPKNARFFVIKSFSEDDIHRSIKYEIWCSTDHGNKRLDAAFKERSGKGPIYLLFSVNGSGHFCGMAQMLSGVDYNSNTGVWVQDKFKGQFKVKWIYVKDVPNGQLRHIRLENNENKPVTNSRDTQEVPPEKGKMVLKIIHSYKHQTSIFDDFVHYEKRQEEEEGKKHAAAVMGGIPGMNSGMDDRGLSRGGGGRGGDRDRDRDRMDHHRGDRDRGGDRGPGGAGDRRGNHHGRH